MAKKEVLKPFIRSWEGGFACISGDKGGATKWGVTIGTFRNVYGQGKSVQDLKNMTESQWDYIYERLFWNKWKANDIKSQSIANLLVDWYWNSGSYGIKLPQKVLGVTQDGIVGAKTLAAINNYPDEKELFDKLWKEREAFFKRIGVGTQSKFLRGWLNRLNGIRYKCLICNGNNAIYF
jgi:lysozyme family protein